MTIDAIKWFPLDRIGELEARIAQLAAVGRVDQRRDALALALGLHGLRVGEVIASNNADLFEPTRVLTVRTLKNGSPRKVPLDQSVIDAINTWHAAAAYGNRADSRKPLLPSRRRARCRRDQFEKLAKQVTGGILGFPLTFHALRHTFAMRLYAASKDLFLVQRMLGHRSVKSTEVYARSLEDMPDACIVRMIRTEAPDSAPPTSPPQNPAPSAEPQNHDRAALDSASRSGAVETKPRSEPPAGARVKYGSTKPAPRQRDLF